MTEHEVLVVLRPVLTVEVDVEELAVPEGLGDAVDEVHAGHLLVADLGVQLRPSRDARASEMNARALPTVGSKDVAAWLVRLRLDRESDVVTAVDDELREHVEGLSVAVQRRPDILCRVGLRAFAPTPEHVGGSLRARRQGRGCA